MAKVRLALVMPTYARRRSSSTLPSSTAFLCGNSSSSMPIKNTWGNSSPLAECKVIICTLSVSSSSSWRSSKSINTNRATASPMSALSFFSTAFSRDVCKEEISVSTLAMRFSAIGGPLLVCNNQSWYSMSRTIWRTLAMGSSCCDFCERCSIQLPNSLTLASAAPVINCSRPISWQERIRLSPRWLA